MSGTKQLSILFLFFPILCAAQEREPFILNGIPTADFPAVGVVGELSVGGFCTGTLVTPNHVLTAAHCAQAILDLGSADSGTFEVGGRIYVTRSIEIISSYNSNFFTDDVALLVLSEPVTNVQPMALSDVPPAAGELVTLVGFGGQGSPESGSDGSFGEKLVGLTTVEVVTSTEISWDFDNAEESNPAPGDSGGPVFIDTGEGYLIAGIVSSGTTADASLGDTTFAMRVDTFGEEAYGTWINDTIAVTQLEIDEPSGSAGPEEAPEDTDGSPPDEQPAAEPDQPTADPEVEAPAPVSNPECPGASPAPEVVDSEGAEAESVPPSVTEEVTDPSASDEDSDEPANDSTGEAAAEEQVATDEEPPAQGGSCKGNRRRFGSRRPTGGYRDASRNYAYRTKTAQRSRANVRR